MTRGMAESGTPRPPNDGPIRLLLVEDTLTDARLLRELLETALPGQHLVEVAPGLAAAEAAIAEQDYQAILLDLDLPDSRGIETLESLFKTARSIPIIVLTGLVDEDVAARAVRCGAQDYLRKGCTDAASIAKAIRYAIDRKRGQDAILESEEKFAKAFAHAPTLMTISSIEDGTYLDVNEAFVRASGFSRQDAIGRTSTDLGWVSPPNRNRLVQMLDEGGIVDGIELTLHAKDGRGITCLYHGELIHVGGHERLLSIAVDITDRKQHQREQEAILSILRLANAHNHVRDLILAVTTFLQEWSGCEAVGVRLREGDDFPYFETRGFPAEFVEAENRLCAVDSAGEMLRDSHGDPVIECMCGNVLCGRFDPSKPFFTDHGSFWSNCTTDILASSTEADRQARTRNRCNGEGYESVALIPMRANSVTFGLLQFNDRRKNRFTPAIIGTLERLGDNLAITLAQRRSAQELQESERKYRSLFTQMLSGFALHEMICDDAGRAVDYVTLEVNTAYESMLNVPASAVIGKKASEMLPKEELEHWLGVFGPVALTGQSARYAMYSPFNQKHFEGAAYSPEKGKFAVNFADITEHKRAAEALRESEYHLRSAAEATGFGMYSYDFATGKATYSPEFMGLYGLPPGATLDLDADFVPITLHPEDKTGFLARMQAANAPGGTGILDHEYRILRPDGQVRWLRARGRTILGPTGRPLQAHGIIQDITDRKQAEETLRREHGFLAMIMETSPAAIVQVGKSGQIVYANSRAEEILGLARSTLLGSAYNAPDWKIAGVNGEPFPENELPFRVVQRTGKPTHGIQHAIEWPDGRRVILSVNAAPLKDSTGSFQGMVAAMEDVTERTLMAMAIEESEARYRNLFNSVLDGYAVHEIILDEAKNPIDYRFLAVNPAFEQMTGFAAADVVGRTVMEVMPGTERHWIEAYGRVATTGVPTRFENYAAHLDRYFEVLAFQPRQGQFACVFRDVTSRKRAEAAIRESEQRYRSLVDNVGLGVVLVGDDYRIRSVNPAQARLFGKATEDFIGKDCFREFEKRDTICPRCPGKVAMETGRCAEVETEGVRDDGRRHQARVQAFPILDSSGKASAFIEVVEDITEHKQAVVALRKSEESLRKAQQVAHVGSWVWHIPSNRLEWSDEMYRIFGVDKASFTGSLRDVIAKAIHPEDRAKVEESNLRVIHEKKPRPLEYRVIRADQTVRVVWAEAGELILDEAGNAVVLTGIVQDITDRKRAEEAHRESEEKFAKAFVASPEAMSIVSLEDGTYVDVNEAFARATGFARDQIVGRTSSDLDVWVDPRDRQRYLEQLRAAGRVRGFEVRYRMRAGEIRDFVVSSEIVRIDGQECSLNFILDIADRKRAEELLRHSAEQWQTTFDGVADAISLLDADCKIVRCNTTMGRLVGLAPEQCVGRSSCEMIHGTKEHTEGCPFARAKRSLRRETHELRIGSTWVRVAADPLVGEDGSLVGAVHIVTDISERKQAEEERQRMEAQYRQAQKMEAIGRLAAGVAHDFNNQLTVIQGYADLLMSDHHEGDPIWEPVTQIRQAALRAHSITSHLLSFSRKQILEAEVVVLGEFLKEAGKPISRMIGEDIRLIVAAAPNIPAVFIDKSGLHQALMNLVVNACDAMPGGGELVLRTSGFRLTTAGGAEFPDASPGDYVLLEVIDSGIGMDARTLELIFEPFFTTKEPGKGTGLGLPMVMGFVRQSKGFIGVRSEPGKGTAVRLLLPLTQHAAAVGKRTAVSASASAGSDRTLMVVEDDPGVRTFLVRVLERSGYRVLAAAGPTEALELSAEHDEPIDLLISDMVMPGMRGDELAAKLKESRRRLRVLFISGYTAGSASCEGELLRKPFKPEDLLARVQSMLSRRRPRRKTKSGE